MKVIVTGAAGFMGSHLVDRLLAQGDKVIGIDNLSAGNLKNLESVAKAKGFIFIKADLLYPPAWVDVFKRTEVVFHFAANPEVRHSTRHPLEHYHQNLTATMNVLEAARKYNVKVVFASSSTVYGDPEVIPTPESHPIKPISIYGATKAAAELLCQTYTRLYGIKTLILRYANIVGPRLGHGAIYDFIEKLKRNPYELEILGDGTQRKSYLHVNDAIEATLAALQYLIEIGKQTETYNIGNTDWTTIKEIADAVVEAMSLQGVGYVYKPVTPDGRGWPGDVKLMLLDVTKIVQDTGWKPTKTSLQAVKETARVLLRESGSRASRSRTPFHNRVSRET